MSATYFKQITHRHFPAIAIIALVSACGSSKTEKVDAGQRKYCDTYCADAGLPTPDGKANDALPVDATLGDLNLAIDSINVADGSPQQDTFIPDVPPAKDTSALDLSPPDTLVVVLDTGIPDSTRDTQLILDTQVSPPFDTLPERVEAASPDTTPDITPDIRPDVPGETSPVDSPLEAGTDTTAIPVDAPTDIAMDSGPIVINACPTGQWAKQLPSAVTPTYSYPASFSGLSSAADGTRWMTGNIFTTKLVDYFGTGTPIAATGDTADIYLAKLDPVTGNATSAWVFGDSYNNDQYATQVTVAGNGQVGMIGNFAGEIDFTANNSESDTGVAGVDYLTNSSAIDFWALFDSAGTPIKSHNVDVGLGGIVSIGANPTTGQDSFVVCGDTSKLVPVATNKLGLLSIPTGASYTNTYGTGRDIVVAKIDATGTVKWGRQIGGTGDQACKAVTVDNHGDVILTGTYNGTLSFGGATTAFPAVTIGPTYGSLYIAKLASDTGEAIAAQAWGTTAGIQIPKSLAIDKDNNVVLAGAIFAGINFGGGKAIAVQGLTDAFVVKFTSALEVVWAKSYGDSTYNQQAYSVATSSNGDVYLTGLFTGNLGDLGLTSFGTTNADVFFAHLASSDGRALCTSRFGEASGGQEGDAITVARLATGNLLDSVIIGGLFSSAINFSTGQNLTTPGAGKAESFIARLAP